MFINYVKNFGLSSLEILFYKITAKLCGNNKHLNSKKNEAILRYLNKNVYQSIKFENTKDMKIESTKYIFCLWWDGIDSAPDIVSKCVESLKQIEGYELVILDKINLSNYITLDLTIQSKFQLGLISITQLSDIIRVNLLAKYNCVWADATLLITNSMAEIDKYRIYSLRGDPLKEYISSNKWTGFFMSSNNAQDIYVYAVEFFNQYWKKYDMLIDYFLIDFIYELLYRNNKAFKDCIDLLPYYNATYELSNLMLESKDLQAMCNILDEYKIHKLSWKYKYRVNITDLLKGFL